MRITGGKAFDTGTIQKPALKMRSNQLNTYKELRIASPPQSQKLFFKKLFINELASFLVPYKGKGYKRVFVEKYHLYPYTYFYKLERKTYSPQDVAKF